MVSLDRKFGSNVWMASLDGKLRSKGLDGKLRFVSSNSIVRKLRSL